MENEFDLSEVEGFEDIPGRPRPVIDSNTVQDDGDLSRHAQNPVLPRERVVQHRLDPEIAVRRLAFGGAKDASIAIVRRDRKTELI